MVTRGIEWAAGLFEGEGCIHCHYAKYAVKGGEAKRGYLHLDLAMTDEDIVRSFHEIVGVGKIYRQDAPSRRNKNYKVQWLWRAISADAEEVFWRLVPWLGDRRREQYFTVRDKMSESRESNEVESLE